jgi:DNA polymerase I
VKVLLLDGNSLTYRAFYALPTDMATGSGQVTNAVFGFSSMLTNLLRDQRPDGVIAAFDRPEPTFRHELEPEYKAQREASPDILRQQMPIVREVLAALGMLSFEAPGWEADDIIATLADQASAAGHEVVVVTGDRDSYQLVHDPLVRVLYNKRGVTDYALYDENGIFERTGVSPSQYPAYAALRGDPSDNLPGVPGVGEKTAAKLITTYGDLDGLFAAVADQTPKLRAALAEHEDRARRNLDLMVLRRDAPVRFDPTESRIRPDLDELRRLFDTLEFRTLFDRMVTALRLVVEDLQGAGDGDSVDVVVQLDPTVVEAGDDDVADLVAAMQAAEHVDIGAVWEGTPGRSSLVGAAFIPRTDDTGGESATYVPAGRLDDVAAALASGAVRWRMHDAKPFMRSLLALGSDADGLVFDTSIAAYLLDPSVSGYGLAEVLERYAHITLPTGPKVASGQLDFGEETPPAPREAAVRAAAVGVLAATLRSVLYAAGMAALYDDVENALVRVLARMEHRGIAVDAGVLRSLNERLTAEVQRHTATLHDVVGRSFNLNSPVQLREILYEERGLKPGKKTKTGYSTDAATLERLRGEWPEFIEPLLAYREAEKLRSTYGEGLLAEIASDGRIHATFNQTVARTGRLSSDQPNLHNIPVRSEEGRAFREAFVAAPGHVLLVADYNQIELRCIAHLANDPGLIGAFTSGEDIHRATAARVFGVDPAEVTLDQRSKAKMVSYGLAYGMEAYGLGQRLGIATDEAAVILDAYFTAFPNVKEYMERTVTEARRRGYTETLFGRRRPIPELQSDNFRVRQAGERQAMNAGIQGLAADIFKVALVRIDAALDDAGVRSRVVLQVHDEVLVEVPDDERADVGPLVIDLLRGAAALDVPLEVNVAWGVRWAEAKA